MALPAHETGFARSKDLNIAYRRFGVRGACPVVIVHGLSYFSYDWIEVAASLAQDREVAAIDLRGFGDSDSSPGRDYSLQAMAADVVAVMDHLKWDRAALVGHSMGGRICLCAAGWYPERAAALACVDFAPDVAAEGRRNVANRIGLQPDVFESVDHALAYHGHTSPERVDPAVRQRFEAFLRPVAGGFALKRDLHFRDSFRRILETGKSPPAEVDLWALLSGLDLPMLFLRGSTSDMFAPETMEKVRKANPRAEVAEIPGSHDLIGENPVAVAAAVQALLEQCG